MKATTITCPRCHNGDPIGLGAIATQARCRKCQGVFGVPSALTPSNREDAGRQKSVPGLLFGALVFLILVGGTGMSFLFFKFCFPGPTTGPAHGGSLAPTPKAAPGGKPPSRSPGSGKAPALLHQANLEYVGAFRVPNYQKGGDELNFTSGAIAFNSKNKSLFIVGHRQALAELSIPETVVNSNKLGKLSTAKVLQGWAKVLPGLSVKLEDARDGEIIGGLLVDNGKLIGAEYPYYTGADKQKASHFLLNSLDLSRARVKGLFRVGKQGPRLVAGYMAPVPKEWQPKLGAPLLTGLAGIPIIGMSSSGPCAFGFDSTTLGPKTTAAIPYLYYPIDKPLGPYESGPANPIQNSTTSVAGVVFVPGTRSVLFFGATGVNFRLYGGEEASGDRYHIGKGPHSLNGEYAFQVWAYDANDFVAVKQGKKKPWQVMPFDVWNFQLPVAGNYTLGGVTYDPSTRRIYVSSLYGDNAEPYTALPLIQVFQVNLDVTPPARPHIGTLCATRDDYNHKDKDASPLPGPIPPGTATALTAGNVYPMHNAKIVNVKFYLDKVGGKLLGHGKPSKFRNAHHNWTLTISTKGLSPGPHTIVGQAEDNAGRRSASIATTMTIGVSPQRNK